jgi:STE24 endopeptidase
VLAHEIGHYKKKHTLQSLILGLAQNAMMFYVLGLFLGNPAVAEALGAQQGSFHLDILAFGILYSPLSMMIGILMNLLSRKNEYEADNYAKTTYGSDAIVNALKKLSVANLDNPLPHPAYTFVHYSHPTVIQRLNALRA